MLLGDVLAIQYENNRPILLCDGRVFTRIAPSIATQYASAPENARPFFQYVADVTVQKMTMTAYAGDMSAVVDRNRL